MLPSPGVAPTAAAEPLRGGIGYSSAMAIAARALLAAALGSTRAAGGGGGGGFSGLALSRQRQPQRTVSQDRQKLLQDLWAQAQLQVPPSRKITAASPPLIGGVAGREGVRLWTGSCSSLGKDIQRVLMCEREEGVGEGKGVNESPQGRLLTSHSS